MDIFDFKSIVVSVSQKIKVRNQDEEDIQQELYIKLLEVLPLLQSLSEQDAVKMCRRVLKNRALDLYRKEHGYTIKRDVVLVSEVEESIMCGIDHIMGAYEAHAEDLIALEQAKELVLDWADAQNEETKVFLANLVSPSPEILRESHKISDRNLDFVPPLHLQKILNFSTARWKLVQKKLQRYLRHHGLSLDVFDFESVPLNA